MQRIGPYLRRRTLCRTARTSLRTLALVAILFCASIPGWPEEPFEAVTDGTTYDVGSEVRIKVFLTPGQTLFLTPLDVIAHIRYAGEEEPLTREGLEVVPNFLPKKMEDSTRYRPLWKIPQNARTGRYDVDLLVRDSNSHQTLLKAPAAASFAVHRKLVQIERVELGKTFYAPGDPVKCRVTIKNLTDHPLSGLRVEFSLRYWPWITEPAEQAAKSIHTLAQELALAPAQEKTVESADAGTAKDVKEASYQQYGVVVWDKERKNVYDIAFSRLTFISPPGVTSPKPYPLQYIYPNLNDVNLSSYRRFYPSRFNSGAIQFDHRHTMFPTGSEAAVKFSIANPTDQSWQKVSVRARLLGPDGNEEAGELLDASIDLDAHSSPLQKQVKFKLPGGKNGVYKVEVGLSRPNGELFAADELELGVNPLPKSILIFCAHEDDEGGWAGLIRAAVENQIPIHVVYFTSGDAGSCDRYYERSCGAAEALNFGELRMQEARRAVGHLGVPREEIYFLGLPDGGSGEIWYNHVQLANPYLSVLLSSDHTPYDNVVLPNLPYARNSVVRVTEELIGRFQPEVIVTAHPPSQGHIDHIVNNYLVVKALQNLLRKGTPFPPDFKLLVDRVYDPKTLPPTPYHYEEHAFYVSGEAAARAQEAWWFYQSQGGNRAQGNIRDFDQLPRKVPYREVLDWKDHEGWNEKR
jgi:LmbE family N-acetylglucosaminyl deacetylase